MHGRKINVFEKLLLIVGIGLTLVGFYLILIADQINSLISWMRLTAIFCWMILLFVVIFTATTENMKEELAIMQNEHVTEIKLLKEIANDQLEEIKLLKKVFHKK